MKPCEPSPAAVSASSVPLSLATLERDQTFDVDVRWDEAQGWSPAGPVVVPPHHSWHMEWVGTEAFPWALSDHAALLRFHATLLDRQITKVAGQMRWQASYRAQLRGICRLPPP